MDRWVHRLVAEAFVLNPENKRTVNHEDGDTGNNHYTNLTWATHQENHKHAYRVLGRRPRPQKGESNGNVKLTEELVRRIKRLCVHERSNVAIARQIGNVVTPAMIGHIRHGRFWAHVLVMRDEIDGGRGIHVNTAGGHKFKIQDR